MLSIKKKQINLLAMAHEHCLNGLVPEYFCPFSPENDYFFNSFPDEGLWDILIKDIPKDAISHTFNMDILKQGVSYDFRVIGVNDYGYGSPSLPSPSISGELSCIC